MGDAGIKGLAKYLKGHCYFASCILWKVLDLETEDICGKWGHFWNSLWLQRAVWGLRLGLMI